MDETVENLGTKYCKEGLKSGKTLSAAVLFPPPSSGMKYWQGSQKVKVFLEALLP